LLPRFLMCSEAHFKYAILKHLVQFLYPADFNPQHFVITNTSAVS
jgi:hypothetical protein